MAGNKVIFWLLELFFNPIDYRLLAAYFFMHTILCKTFNYWKSVNLNFVKPCIFLVNVKWRKFTDDRNSDSVGCCLASCLKEAADGTERKMTYGRNSGEWWSIFKVCKWDVLIFIVWDIWMRPILNYVILFLLRSSFPFPIRTSGLILMTASLACDMIDLTAW